MIAQEPAATVADVHNVYGVVVDGEHNPVYMRLPAIKQLSHLEGKASILGCKRASLGKSSQGRYRAFESQKPPNAGVTSTVCKPAIPESLPRRARPARSFQRGKPYFWRMSARNSAAGLVRPAFRSS